MMKTMTTTTNFYHDTITIMVADGWTVHPGPWGAHDSERTVELRKEHTPFDGHFKAWFIDRDFVIKGEKTRYIKHASWFVSGLSQRKRERSFKIDNPEVYDFGKYLHAVGVCDISGEYHGYEKLIPVSFANAVAPEYAEEAIRKWETPGWNK